MLKFKKIELRNFLSFGNATTELDLEFHGTTLILGENLDAAGANGVGKSTIINGISFGLYNKPISNISKERLINRTNNTKNTAMEVRLFFTKGDDNYEIYRARGEVNATVLKRNDEDITPDSISAIDKAIEDIVGFSYDIFSRVVVFAGSATPFLDLPVSSQRNHIEELFNITTLTQKALALREKIKTTESDIKVQDALIQQQELTRDLRAKHITEAEARILKWEEDKVTSVKRINESLSTIDGIDFEAEQKAHENVNRLVEQIGLKRVAFNQSVKNLVDNSVRYYKWQQDTSLRHDEILRQLRSVEGIDIDAEQKLHNDVAEFTRISTKAKAEIKLLNTTLDKYQVRQGIIDTEVDHLSNSKCPYCSQHFDSKDKIATLKAEYEENATLLIEVNAEISALQKQSSDADETVALSRANIKHTDLAALMKVLANKQALEAELSQINVAVNPYHEAIQKIVDDERLLISAWEELNTSDKAVLTEFMESGSQHLALILLDSELKIAKVEIKHDNIGTLLSVRSNTAAMSRQLEELEATVNPHLDAYETLIAEGETNVDYASRDTLKATVEHQQFLLKLLTDKNSFIRKNIVNQTIPFLNSQINAYTKELGLPHIVRFDPDMSCTVRECGRDLDFGNLSGGEKKRVNLALSLAFRDVLHHLHSKVNLLMLDEVDGGSVDTIGVSSMVRMLKRKARDESMSVWTISHHPEMLGRMDREVVIRKENGFSSICFGEHD